MDLNEVMGTKLNEEGVANVTRGAVLCGIAAANLREILKQADPAMYADYRAVRYPEGEGSDTMETRRDSVRFLFDAARDLLVPHYVPAG